MRCKICNRLFKSNKLASHLYYKHNIKQFDYAVKYLNHFPQPPECKCGCGKKVIKWRGLEKGWANYIKGHNPVNYSKIDYISLGEKVSKTMTQKYKDGWVAPRKGHNKFNDESIKKMSDKMKGRKLSKKTKRRVSNTLKTKYSKGEIKVWNKGLTKETDKRIMKISDNLKGNKLSEITKIKISNTVKKHHKNGIYSDTTNLSNAIKRLGEQGKLFTQSDKGRKLMSEEMTKKNLNGIMRIENSKNKTNPEIFIDELFSNELEYVGNGKLWLTYNGKHKNPDFISTKNENKIVEVFGDYWHDESEVNEYIEGYKSIGKECLIIWESEINNNPDLVKIKINQFLKGEKNECK